MRPIKFKGKRIDNGEWIEGDLLHDYWFSTIHTEPYCIRYKIDNHYSYPIPIDPATLCQFTGLYDKDGKEVWEGDMVVYTLNHDSTQMQIESVIKWFNHAWRLDNIWLLTEIRTITVIGNIHDKEEI